MYSMLQDIKESKSVLTVLRISKNQTTRLIFALLQLNSVKFSSLDVNDSRIFKNAIQRGANDLFVTKIQINKPKGFILVHVQIMGFCSYKLLIVL